MNQRRPTPMTSVTVSQSLSYQITDQPLPHKSLKKLPRRVREEVEELSKLAELEPAQAISPLLKLTKRYPHVPMFYNYLSVAYERNGQLEKAYASLEENYKRHPDYLFAKTNYAFLCLKNHYPELIPEIFDHKFDLKLLYPERAIFHLSEVTSFMGVMALYHHAIGQTKVAQSYYETLQKLEPDGFLIKQVHSVLYPSWLRRLFKVFRRTPKASWKPTKLLSPAKDTKEVSASK